MGWRSKGHFERPLLATLLPWIEILILFLCTFSQLGGDIKSILRIYNTGGANGQQVCFFHLCLYFWHSCNAVSLHGWNSCPWQRDWQVWFHTLKPSNIKMQLVNGITNTGLIHCRSIILFTYHFFTLTIVGTLHYSRKMEYLKISKKRVCVWYFL